MISAGLHANKKNTLYRLDMSAEPVLESGYLKPNIESSDDPGEKIFMGSSQIAAHRCLVKSQVKRESGENPERCSHCVREFF